MRIKKGSALRYNDIKGTVQSITKRAVCVDWENGKKQKYSRQIFIEAVQKDSIKIEASAKYGCFDLNKLQKNEIVEHITSKAKNTRISSGAVREAAIQLGLSRAGRLNDKDHFDIMGSLKKLGYECRLPANFKLVSAIGKIAQEVNHVADNNDDEGSVGTREHLIETIQSFSHIDPYARQTEIGEFQDICTASALSDAYWGWYTKLSNSSKVEKNSFDLVRDAYALTKIHSISDEVASAKIVEAHALEVEAQFVIEGCLKSAKDILQRMVAGGPSSEDWAPKLEKILTARLEKFEALTSTEELEKEKEELYEAMEKVVELDTGFGEAVVARLDICKTPEQLTNEVMAIMLAAGCTKNKKKAEVKPQDKEYADYFWSKVGNEAQDRDRILKHIKENAASGKITIKIPPQDELQKDASQAKYWKGFLSAYRIIANENLFELNDWNIASDGTATAQVNELENLGFSDDEEVRELEGEDLSALSGEDFESLASAKRASNGNEPGEFVGDPSWQSSMIPPASTITYEEEIDPKKELEKIHEETLDYSEELEKKLTKDPPEPPKPVIPEPVIIGAEFDLTKVASQIRDTKSSKKLLSLLEKVAEQLEEENTFTDDSVNDLIVALEEK